MAFFCSKDEFRKEKCYPELKWAQKGVGKEETEEMSQASNSQSAIPS